jgi:DNA polymerase I
MTARDLRTLLRGTGVELVSVGGDLRVSCPTGALSAELRGLIAARKAELLTLVVAEANLAADGRDILAVLADRGIAVRLAEDGRPWAGPAELIDEADQALLAAHRDAVLAALGSAVPEPQASAGGDQLEGGTNVPTRFPGSDRLPDASTEHGAVHINVPGGDPQAIDQIANVLAWHPGADEVLLHIVSGDRMVTMQVGERFRVAAGQAVRAELDACFGLEVARLEAVQSRSAGVNVRAGMSGVVPGTGDEVGMSEVVPGTDNQSSVSGVVPITENPMDTRVVLGSTTMGAASEVVLIAATEAGMSEVVPGTGMASGVVPIANPPTEGLQRGPASGVVPIAGDGQLVSGVVHITEQQPDTQVVLRPGSHEAASGVVPIASVAIGGVVPDQEGRPASPGAEPTGGSQPGTAAPLALFDGSDPHGRDPEPVGGANGGGEALARIEAGAQAFDTELVLVTTVAELERALPEILAAPALGFDTEGTGLDPLTAKIRLVQVATGRRTYLIDVFRLDARALQPVLDHAQRLVGHNLKFDLRMVMAAGIRLPADIGRRMSDTMLAGRLLGAGLDGQRYRLADLADRYLGVELDKTEQVSDWSGELTADQLAYAARDAAVLLPLCDHLRAELDRAGLSEVAGIEHRALPAMVWLEQTGAPFDQAAWLRLAEIAEERRLRLERDLDAMAPSNALLLPLSGVEEASTRWSSPAQVRRLLASRGVVVPDTRDETLHEHHDDDPLIPLLLQHREAAKRSGAFGREFLRFVHSVTGRIHADFFQLGSEAGRASCRSPNLQQIPHTAEYRACFRALEGRVLVGADYSQIEPRIAAEISGEERLLAAYRDRRDVYRQVASELGVERGVAKTIVLGALYGLGARGLVRRLKADAGIVMAEEQARAYLDAFFAGYPALDRWRSGRRGVGAVATRTLSGRRRLNVEDYTRKVNTPIQGSAADVFKLAMALLYESRDVGPDARLVLSVHDELVLEVGEADAAVARHWLARCMREAGQVYLERVPVVVEVGVGATWADTKKTAAPVEEVDEWAA